jgi:hypothetical protein
MPMKRVSLFIPIPQLKLLRERAQKTGLKVAELIRRAIDRYLEENPK